MDSVEGARGDSARLLTPCTARAASSWRGRPLPDGTCATGPGGARACAGAGRRRHGEGLLRRRAHRQRERVRRRGRHRGAARRAGGRDEAGSTATRGRASRRARRERNHVEIVKRSRRPETGSGRRDQVRPAGRGGWGALPSASHVNSGAPGGASSGFATPAPRVPGDARHGRGGASGTRTASRRGRVKQWASSGSST